MTILKQHFLNISITRRDLIKHPDYRVTLIPDFQPCSPGSISATKKKRQIAFDRFKKVHYLSALDNLSRANNRND